MQTNSFSSLPFLFIKGKAKLVRSVKCVGIGITPISTHKSKKESIFSYLDGQGRYSPILSEKRKKEIKSSCNLKEFTRGLLSEIFTECTIVKQLNSI